MDYSEEGLGLSMELQLEDGLDVAVAIILIIVCGPPG